MYPPNGPGAPPGPGGGMPSFSGRPPGMPPGMPPGQAPMPGPFPGQGQPGPPGAPQSLPAGGMPHSHPGGFVPPGGARPMMPPPMPGSMPGSMPGPRPMAAMSGPFSGPGGMPMMGPPPPRPGMMMAPPGGAPMMMGPPGGGGAPMMMGGPPGGGGAPMMMGPPGGGGAPMMRGGPPGAGGAPMMMMGPPGGAPMMAPPGVQLAAPMAPGSGGFGGPPRPFMGGGSFSMPGGGMPPGMAPGMPGMPAFPPPPAAPSMMQLGGPPPPPAMGAYAPPGPPQGGGGGYDGYGAQNVMEQFESLTLGSGVKGAVGGAGDTVDPAQLPRPVGQQRDRALAAQPLFDNASCSARNMRLTVNGIPNSVALRARWPLPIGVVVHPMADEAAGGTVPVVSLGAGGIVRCRRCRTYMNPFVEWTDGGRRFKCNVCMMLNEIPVEYYCALDHNGRRRDADERPEISTGTVEYVAPAEYMVRPPMPPVYMFVIDVSQAAVSSGLVACAVAAIRECLERLPGDERTLIGFITFDSSLHFYNLKSSLAAPQMLVVTELGDPFVPLPDDLLVNLRDSLHLVTALLDSMPTTFATSTVIDCATGPALQAAFLLTSHVGCKLLLFQGGVPSLGVGKVKNRENVALYNTEREASLRCPEDPFFKRFAAECNRAQISVDVFVGGSAAYMDLASLAALPRYSCGEVYYYPSFSAARDGPKLHAELVHNLVRPTAWEAVMRVRCSKGLRISSFHGHFFNRSTDLLALPVCDPDKAFAVQISHEENLVEGVAAFVQCALLFTNSTGERRIRVHTLSVPVVTDLSELYKGADAGALACLTSKLAVEKSLTARLDETRTSVQTKLTSALKEFRIMNAAAVRQPNKFVFPETLKYLPIWTLGLLKTAALRGGAKDVTPDERIAVGHHIMAASTDTLLRLLYPDLYVLHDPNGAWGMEQQDGTVPLPPTAPLSMSVLSESGAFLLDNGRVLILWLGRLIAPQWCVEVFGAEPGALPLDGPALAVEPARNTHMSQRVNAVLGALRRGRPVHAQCFALRQGSSLEMHVAPYFVEDRSQASPSYPDFMLSLHKAVMSNNK